MKAFWVLLGIACVIGAIVLGFYVGVYVMFIGGIVQAIDGVKASPTDARDIAVGIVRIMFAAFAGWLAFLLGVFVSAGCFAASEGGSWKHRRRR